MKLTHKITAITSAILLSVAVSSPANAVEVTPEQKVSVIKSVAKIQTPITAPDTAVVSFDLVGTTSSRPAPVAQEAPVVEVAVASSAPATYLPPSAPVPAQVVAAQAPAPAPAPVQSHGGLASAALAQLGVAQDCTRMVENALASIGRPVGDLGPAQFLSVGTVVGGAPQAGDILVYGGSHVAIALGNGQAVHGGFNGGTTAIGPVDVGQGIPTVVRV